MAALPAARAMVCVGPPLVANMPVTKLGLWEVSAFGKPLGGLILSVRAVG